MDARGRDAAPLGQARAGPHEGWRTGMSGETLNAIGIREILDALPHRYPFLMVDRIIDIRGDEHGIGIKNVTANEPHFQGHFPNNPVMPGVLVLEGMAQTAGVLCIRSLPGQAAPKIVYFLTI